MTNFLPQTCPGGRGSLGADVVGALDCDNCQSGRAEPNKTVTCGISRPDKPALSHEDGLLQQAGKELLRAFLIGSDQMSAVRTVIFDRPWMQAIDIISSRLMSVQEVIDRDHPAWHEIDNTLAHGADRHNFLTILSNLNPFRS